MTEIELETYLGKKIRVKCIDGDIVEGMCEIYLHLRWIMSRKSLK